MTEFDSIVDKLTHYKVVFPYTQKICKRDENKEGVKYSNTSYLISFLN